MESLPENQLPFSIYFPATDKIKQREALENAYGNFVEPYINQAIAVNMQSLPTTVAVPGFYCASGWLLLTILYCVWMRWRKESKL
jgi:hypothetical protein